MALEYGYFDSEISGYDDEGMPIFDRAKTSDFMADFFSQLISSGVMAEPATCFRVTAYDGMTVQVAPGYAFVKGRFAYDEDAAYLTLDDTPTGYSRFDMVVLRNDYVNRICEIVIKTGTPAASPAEPELSRSGDYYELCLAKIKVTSGQTAIAQSNITDTRYNNAYCGVVTQLVDGIDTSTLLEQMEASGNEKMQNIVDALQQFESDSETDFQEWFETIKGILGEDEAGNLQNEIDEVNEHLDETDIRVDVIAGFFSTPENHGAFFRGNYLGTRVTSEQCTAILEGTFDDLWLGDYWVINGWTWRIVDFDYWYNTGNSDGIFCTDHHVVIMPDEAIYTAPMESSGTTENGYAGSLMYTDHMATVREMVNDSFSGSISILNHSDYFITGASAGRPTSGSWYTSDVELPSEVMMFGHNFFSPSADGSSHPQFFTNSRTQLALMRIAPRFIRSSSDSPTWLRDTATATSFAYINANGYPSCTNAAYSRGVRPVFPIYYPS